jgi:hypothetical protein
MTLARTLFACTLAVAGCSGDDTSNNNVLPSLDLAIGPQLTHIGPDAVTCCMVTSGDGFVMYLAHPTPGATDARGRSKPALGELHIANEFGTDYKLASGVPAFAYQFVPGGRFAAYLSPTKNTFNSLQFASLARPQFTQPTILTVVKDGLAQDEFNPFQGYFSDTGSYLISFVHEANVDTAADVHIISTSTAQDLFSLGNGSALYQQNLTFNDTLVFGNDKPSTVPGQPSEQGLYVVNLGAAADGIIKPARVDTHVDSALLTADAQMVVYTKTNGDLFVFGLSDQTFVKLASNVATFSLGPGNRGPLTYITNDLALHVTPVLQREILALPANSVDLFSPLSFAPDMSAAYFFRHVAPQDNHGELYRVSLVAADKTPQLIDTRASTVDVNFVEGRLVFLRNVDSYGNSGDLTVASYDGSNPFMLAPGSPTGELRAGSAFPPTPPAPRHIRTGPLDFSVSTGVLMFANLVQAEPDTNTAHVPIAGGRKLIGGLGFTASMSQPERVLDSAVRSGMFRFSDDGFVLAYAAGAVWSPTANNYVGALKLHDTLADAGVVPWMLDGVAEMGPIRNRQLFVSAVPKSSAAGIYFIVY